MTCMIRDKSVLVNKGEFNDESVVPGLTNLDTSSQLESEEEEEEIEPPKEGPSSPKRLALPLIPSTCSSTKLRNVGERLKDPNLSAKKREGLELEYADGLCTLGRFQDAAWIYLRVFSNEHKYRKLTHERLKHFLRLTITVTVGTVIQAGMSVSKLEHKSGPEENDKIIYKPREYCPDPLSCPICASLFSDPISLPCGHTYCRKCILKTKNLQEYCMKCGLTWYPRDGVLPQQAVGPIDDMIRLLKPNVLIGKLVEEFWPNELKALDLKAKGNDFQQKGLLDKSLELYSQAIELAPTDFFLYGNRSLTYYKLGMFELSLEDATKATELKPDWAKGYFRKGSALQALKRHEEAFQAFYECMTLEDSKSLKQVRLELSKELFGMLSTAKPGQGSRSTLAEVNPDVDMDNDDSNKGMPQVLAVLMEFATSSALKDTSHTNQCLPAWMTRAVAPFKLGRRQIKVSPGFDPRDFDCPLCIQIMVAPVTTPCGHTFCRRCLDRSLDHSPECPMCKSTTLIQYLAERRDKVNEFILECMKRAMPEEYHEREKSITAEIMELAGIRTDPYMFMNSEERTTLPAIEVPIFVCTISFPYVRCPLHIYEPRYRLMIRRTMESGSRQFGITASLGNNRYSDYGTILEIHDIHAIRDGRSVIDTRGRQRFKVLERRIRDGYNVATVEYLKDDHVFPHQLGDLMRVHNETIEMTRQWIRSIPIEMRMKFENHYGEMPAVESDFWDMPNGPSWHWWTMTILPFDSTTQVNVLSLTSLKRRLELIQRILRFLRARKV